MKRQETDSQEQNTMSDLQKEALGKRDLQGFLKRERRIFIFVTVGVVLVLAAALIWEYSPLRDMLPQGCVIAQFLHIYCPGCGGTRACFQMMHGRPVKSFLYHPIILFVVLLLADYYIGAVITLIKRNGKRYYYLRDWFCYIALAIVLGNFIIRNVLLVGFHIDYIGDLLQYWS